MTGERAHEGSWWRRPRKPVPAVLANPVFAVLAAFWLGVALLVGLAVVLDEPAWWAKTAGGLVSLLSVALGVVLVAYLRRPVDDREPGPDPATVDAWADALERHGSVEIGLSKSKVARAFTAIAVMVLIGGGLVWIGGVVQTALGVLTLLMAVFLALVPHLELVTGGRPAIRVDTRGVEIARRPRLTIPWDAVQLVRAHRGSRTQRNVVVHVSESCFRTYLASRPWLLRVTDALVGFVTGPGFSIPSTTTADPETLAAWLDEEVRRGGRSGVERQPGVPGPA